MKRGGAALLAIFLLVTLSLPAAAQQEPCDNVLPSRLRLNSRARVEVDTAPALQLREAPQAPDGEIIRSMSPLDIFYVLEGPRCSGVYAWFRVTYREPDTGLINTGWLAEGNNEEYYVEPYPPGA